MPIILYIGCKSQVTNLTSESRLIELALLSIHRDIEILDDPIFDTLLTTKRLKD
jgi:hypothetical protein